MTGKLLESGAISAFCSSVATMLAAGVQTDEAVHMLAENREQSEFKRVCDAVYSKVVEGSNLADAMEATGRLPRLRNGNRARRRGIGPHRARAAQPRALLR